MNDAQKNEIAACKHKFREDLVSGQGVVVSGCCAYCGIPYAQSPTMTPTQIQIEMAKVIEGRSGER